MMILPEEPIKFENTRLPDVVELKNITLQYPDNPTPTIENLNLLIEDKQHQGQFICILGESGCGKSTLLRFICGLQKPTSGEVLLYGKPRTDEDRVGMVFQQYSSLPWLTVEDNIALSLRFKGVPKQEQVSRVQAMIELVGLQDHAKKYAQYPLLSGGQLQRVAIARSLLANSRILVADEPLGALDSRTRLKMQDSLKDIKLKLSATDTSTTFILVTHDIPEAVYLADEIYIMKSRPGRIVKRIRVDIPQSQRNKEIKKTDRFRNLVSEIEDYMS
jgi:NitT/TauT family transport system ATP-binding protein